MAFLLRSFCSCGWRAMANTFAVVTEGAPDTLEYRVFFEKDGHRVSPFHDIPLVANAERGTYNMVSNFFYLFIYCYCFVLIF
jgi:hypothetical protein